MKQINVLLLLLYATVLFGCIGTRQITVETDYARSCKRIKTTFLFGYALERFSPLQRWSQTVVKDLCADSSQTYHIYDILELRSESFLLDSIVCVIADGISAVARIERFESGNKRVIDENRRDILTADSTKLSVVTSYNYRMYREYKIVYSLSVASAQQIRQSQSVKYQYYAGHDMITIALTDAQLKRFKLLIDMR